MGQLGNGGANANRGTPGAVVGFDDPSDPDVIAIAAGDYHAFALLANRTLRAWGLDSNGQLGDGGPKANKNTPVAVDGYAKASDPNVSAIDAGGFHSMAVLSDGTLRAWGFDFFRPAWGRGSQRR